MNDSPFRTGHARVVLQEPRQIFVEFGAYWPTVHLWVRLHGSQKLPATETKFEI